MLKPLAVLGGFDDRAVSKLRVNPRAFTCMLFRVSSLGINTHGWPTSAIWYAFCSSIKAANVAAIPLVPIVFILLGSRSERLLGWRVNSPLFHSIL
jgi:hypothetical protein